ncbi:MAG: alanine racemase [Acidimicrobiia bacterium]|nr:alanine racemase [Acidimicrobiia bacterium]
MTQHMSESLSIRDGRLFIEDRDVAQLAEEFGTPLFVVSERQLVSNLREYREAFERHWPEGRARIMAAIKANPNTAIRRILTREGAGCDTFGMGELELALRGGVDPDDLAVNGSIKSRAVIARAVEVGCHVILDSPIELEYCQEEAERAGTTVPVLLRVKPYLEDFEVPSDFFPNRTVRDMTQTVKYGIPTAEMLPMVKRAIELPNVDLVGVHSHAGRHSKKLDFWRSLVTGMVRMIDRIRDEAGGEWTPSIVSFGGGMAAILDRETRVAVTDYESPSIDDYARVITDTFRTEMGSRGYDLDGMLIEVEPGRGLHNETGIHIAKVHVVKHETEHIDRYWLETDTSEVFLSIGGLNVEPPFDYLFANKADAESTNVADIAGITCNYECLVEQAPVPDIETGDILTFLNTGSYIEPYTCNFNALPRPGMVLVSGDSAEWIKRPETQDEVFARDIIPAHLEAIGGAI